jgi:hypothetical protein
MSNIVYVSENKVFSLNPNDANPRELTLQRAVKYKQTIQNINKRKEWKNSGSGALFTGMQGSGKAVEEKAYVMGVSGYEGGFIYSINIDGVGGMYSKSVADDLYEGHITANDSLYIGSINVKGNQCAASVGDSQTRNLAVFELPSGRFTELTEGDTIEDYPSFSIHSENRIFFSSAGLARYPDGTPVCGPYAAMVYDTSKGEMNELFADEKFDYIRVKDDKKGNIYFIKRPYVSQGQENVNILADILLFPWRIVKAVFGFFNYISIIFGGESLRSGSDPHLNINTKAKRKSQQELFVDGNVINAESTYNRNKQEGDKFPGLIPHSWELIRIEPDGSQVCLKKGVLDYTLCDNGDILYSNGRAIIRLSGDEETLVEKCKLANSIIMVSE